MLQETIAAISTPPGKGGIGIVRVSGPEAIDIADRTFSSAKGESVSQMGGYTVHLGWVHTIRGEQLDQCLLLVFRGPKSYTGEDVVEFQCHGGETVTENVLRAVLEAGAQPASKGEFTRRAFLNGRIDLTEAEAVMAIINASSYQGEQAAVSVASGSLAKRLASLREQILSIQTQLAAEIDFPEEDVQEVERSVVKDQMTDVRQSLQSLVGSYDSGQVLLRGVSTAIVGSPNVGKSTLLNRLAGYERAIVSSEAGTTRDIVEERVSIGGIVLNLADTAGIRAEAAGEVERIGIERTMEKLEQVSFVLAVFDQGRPLSKDDLELVEALKGRPVLCVINKSDLPQAAATTLLKETFPHCVEISALEDDVVEKLGTAIQKVLGTENFDANAPLLANERQRACALRALQAVEEATQSLEDSWTLDVCYALLDEALMALYELTGENASEEVIDGVFENFCVGK